MPINQRLKNVIAAIKYKHGLKQAEIADRMGIKNTYLSDVINGRSPLSELFSDKLITAFSISKIYLLSGEGEVFEEEEKAPSTSEIISMPCEVFEQITRLTETVLSQQKTIEGQQKLIEEFLQEQKKMRVQTGGNVGSVAVNG